MNKKKDTEKKNQKMKGKLIKRSNSRFDLYTIEDVNQVNTIASSFDNPKGKLSVKNCESIVNDFDLYGEAVDYAARQGHPSPEGFSDEQVGLLHGYIDGYEQAIKNFGDKKFTAEDMRKAFSYGMDVYAEPNDWDKINPYQKLNNYIQSLQPNSWDVEVEMKKVIDETKIVGTIKGVKGSGNKITTYKSVPKLDENNCLILKRIK